MRRFGGASQKRRADASKGFLGGIRDSLGRLTGLDVAQAAGFGTFFAWAFLVLVGPVPVDMLGTSGAVVAVARLCGMGALGLTLVGAMTLAGCAHVNLFGRGAVRIVLCLAMLAAVLSTALVFLSPGGLEPPAVCAIWCAMGLCNSCVVMLWSRLLLRSGHAPVWTRISLSFIIGGLLFVVVSFFRDSAFWAAMAFMPVLSLAVLCAIAPSCGISDDSATCGVAGFSLRDFAASARAGIPAFAVSCHMATGFVCCRLTVVQGDSGLYPMLGLAWAAAGLIVLLDRGGVVNGGSMSFVVAQICASAVLVMGIVFLPSECAVFPGLGLLCIFALGDIFPLSRASESSLADAVDPVLRYWLIRATGALFILVGWLLGLVVHLSPLPVQISLMLSSFALFVLLIVGLFLTSNVEVGGRVAGPMPKPSAAAPEPSVPELPCSNRVSYEGLDAGLWVAVDKFGLTSREVDVVQYLARGRNAQAIADKLCLSPATVKSHMYRIYAKLDVHSQQELIELIEGLDPRPSTGGSKS